jgi:hypothetical protein
MFVLDELPAWIGISLFTLVFAGVAALAHFIFRRYVPAEKLLPHHEVAGFLVAVVGVLYAVVLGFVVVTAWTAFDQAQRDADVEASDAAEIFYMAEVLPQPLRSRLQKLVADYAFEVRDHEWPKLVRGEQDDRARDLMVTAWEALASQPVMIDSTAAKNARESLMAQHIFVTFEDLRVHRRLRLIDAGTYLSNALYFVLLAGAALLMVFVFLFGVTNQALQLTMTALVAAMIGMLLAVILDLDRPYAGAIRVSPDAWTIVIENNHLADYR